MNALRLSFNLLRRDWRAGEWHVLLFALLLAVSSLATVGLFADRVKQALTQQAASILGADLRITSTRPLSPDYRRMAQMRGLRATESQLFPSMVSHEGAVQLAEIQSVEAGYPLRGEIELDGGRLARGIPNRGTVWVDDRLMRRFALHAGDTIGIGAAKFEVAARIVKDVDQSVSFLNVAPRVLMNWDDLPGTGLMQEGSRIVHRLMVAGDGVDTYRRSLRLTVNEKLEDVRDARPEIRIALERAGHFMGLAALTASVLAGIAIALAARRYVVRHMDGCAVMRCLGATESQVRTLFFYQFTLVGLIAVVLGVMLGYAVQALLIATLMPGATLPMPGVYPALQAGLAGMVLLMGFGFLPLWQLGRVTPLKVMRRELGLPKLSGYLLYGVALLALAGLFLWQSGSMTLGLVVLAGVFACVLVFGVCTRLALLLLSRSFNRASLRNLERHSGAVTMQVVALSLGGMALLVLTLVRADLIESWQGKLPVDAPNRFLVGVQPEQIVSLQQFFTSRGMVTPQLLPMVKGRLVAINDRAIDSSSYAEPRARSLVEREFNLSYADELPEWNELVQGRWWGAAGDGTELSVEEGIAKTLGIRMNDVLRYDVAGSQFSAKVTSLRRVQWDSMKVNFFVIGTRAQLAAYPASYLSSFYLPAGREATGDELVREFPNLLLINTEEAILAVRDIIARVSYAVSALFIFALLSGILVLQAALMATGDERMREAAILRTLGAGRTYLNRLHREEFFVTGALAGACSAGGASLLSWQLARRVFEIPYRADALLWLWGVVGGIVLVMLMGWLNTRRLGKIPALRILRED